MANNPPIKDAFLYYFENLLRSSDNPLLKDAYASLEYLLNSDNPSIDASMKNNFQSLANIITHPVKYQKSIGGDPRFVRMSKEDEVEFVLLTMLLTLESGEKNRNKCPILNREIDNKKLSDYDGDELTSLLEAIDPSLMQAVDGSLRVN